MGNSEFPEEVNVSGDVLSHIAQTVDIQYEQNRKLHVSLLHNPSHLEVSHRLDFYAFAPLNLRLSIDFLSTCWQ